MCQCVIYKDKKYCTQGELLTICPAGLVVRDYHPDTCLCPVDLPLTASANGYLIDSMSDPFQDDAEDVIFSKEAIIRDVAMERTEIMSICSRYGFNFIDVEDDEIVCCRDGLFYRISRNRFPGRLQEPLLCSIGGSIE